MHSSRNIITVLGICFLLLLTMTNTGCRKDKNEDFPEPAPKDTTQPPADEQVLKARIYGDSLISFKQENAHWNPVTRQMSVSFLNNEVGVITIIFELIDQFSEIQPGDYQFNNHPLHRITFSSSVDFKLYTSVLDSSGVKEIHFEEVTDVDGDTKRIKGYFDDAILYDALGSGMGLQIILTSFDFTVDAIATPADFISANVNGQPVTFWTQLDTPLASRFSVSSGTVNLVASRSQSASVIDYGFVLSISGLSSLAPGIYNADNGNPGNIIFADVNQNTNVVTVTSSQNLAAAGSQIEITTVTPDGNYQRVQGTFSGQTQDAGASVTYNITNGNFSVRVSTVP